MRWSSFFILAYIALGLWLGTGGFLAIGGATPNLVLIAAVFVCVNAPRDSALLGVFLLGLFQDMLSPQPLGLYALSYGLAGLLVVGSRQIAYSGHPLTHFVLAFGGGLVVAVIMLLHSWIRPAGAVTPIEPGEPAAPSTLSIGSLFLGVVYTAAIAPFVLWILGKLKPMFGFSGARTRYG